GLASAQCNKGTAKTLSTLGFNNNQIDPGLLNPVAVAIAKTFPVTNDPCGRILYGMIANQDEDQVVSRLDYTISGKQSVFGGFMLGRLNTGSTFDGKNPLSINTYGYKDFDYGVTVGDTYLISSNIVNSLRFGANRTNIVKIGDDYKNWADFGANVTPLGGKMI